MNKNRRLKAAEAGETGKPVSVEDLVPVRIMRIADVISRLATRGFKGQFDLRNTDFRILNLLDHAPDMTVNEIARRTHVDKAWISRSLGQLSKKGLVKRETDKKDSRMAVISLTKYGQSLLEEIRPLAAASEARMLDGIEDRSFKRDLDRLMKNIEAMYSDQAASQPD